MPIYEYKCSNCGEKWEHFQHKVGPDDKKLCYTCGYNADLAVSAPVMRPDSYWNGHYDPTFGYVTSKSQLRAKEKRAGLAPSEAGIERDAARARQYRQEKADKQRLEAVANTVKELGA